MVVGAVKTWIRIIVQTCFIRVGASAGSYMYNMQDVNVRDNLVKVSSPPEV